MSSKKTNSLLRDEEASACSSSSVNRTQPTKDLFALLSGIFEHENHLFHNGIGFFVAAQAFLIGAFYTLLTSSFCSSSVQELGFAVCRRQVKWISWIGVALSIVTLLRLIPSFFFAAIQTRRRSTMMRRTRWTRWSCVAVLSYIVFNLPSLGLPGAFIAFWIQALLFK